MPGHNYFACFVLFLSVSFWAAVNALRLCEAPKKNGAKRGFFSELRKTAVVRRVTGGRTWNYSGAVYHTNPFENPTINR